MTPHVYSAPQCQNQNPSEHKIQDIKHTAIMILFALLVPLKFWCYAIKYAVDCLNHISKKGLSWRTSKEVLGGNTVDISVFFYQFWQPIKYLDHKIKFPNVKWQNGHFVGIT
eukprot:15366746-Ditylum_brightwellii.AAC.1